MTPVLGLLVVVRVEVDVVDDDDVGGRQVDAEAAGSRRQQEDEDLLVPVELVNQLLSAHDDDTPPSHTRSDWAEIVLPVLVCGGIITQQT